MTLEEFSVHLDTKLEAHLADALATGGLQGACLCIRQARPDQCGALGD
jgi:hypothetical protein